ncbi:MAG: Pseudaminic acid synthase [Parcubacteria group bacterium GW2011_GWA2_42_11]|nr:MAG: Pseudaminic acid synthase [Parcubacteria group bacterium GW2011_GWA2_42_11]
MAIKPIKIKTKKGERLIGPGQPVFIVAELSGNHHLKYETAKKLIDAAVRAGADAVKLQTYTADTITIDCNNKYFQVKVNDAWKGQTLHSLYQQAYTPWDWQPKLKQYAESKGLILFSTPFDATAVDFLEKMRVPLYKVASFEVVDIPLLEKIGQTKKPVMMARGMASEQEIALAIKTLKKFGAPQVSILHCLSAYPAKVAEMDLRTIPALAEKFKLVTGLSDHSLGQNASIAAVSLGAMIIEKHLILDRREGGPDAAFSLEPEEFGDLVKSIREVEAALGKVNLKISASEKENVQFRKSLFAVQDIRKGEKLTKNNIRSIRPGYGLAPKHYRSILGRIAARDIKKGTPLKWNLTG